MAGLPEDHPQKQRAKAREWVLRRLADFAQIHNATVNASVNDFIHAYNTGDIVIPPQHQAWMPLRHGARHLHRATLLRWRKDYREKGLYGLTDGYGKTKGKSKIETNDDLKKVVLGAILKYPHITGKKIKQYLEAAHPELDIISIKSIERYISNWKKDNAQPWTFMTNPDKWKNNYMVAFGSHHERVTHLNHVWELDSTPGDWMLIDGRHSVIGVVDLYSRRLKLNVSKTSKATAVCHVYRRAVLDWGINDISVTDNGKDYVSNQFMGVLMDLEVTQELCIPFASEEKGTIESTLGTMSHGILDLMPGFIGHNVAERKVIEARKSFARRIMTHGEVVEVELTSDQLQEKLDQWTDHVYMHDPHSGLEGKTPFEVAAAYTGEVRRISDERALDALLAQVAGTRTIKKKGIRLDNHQYIHPLLGDRAGEDVYLKYDEHDMGRLYVYSDNNEFICVAECAKLTGISQQEWAVVSKKHQKKFMTEQSAEYRQFKRELKDDIAEVVIQHRIEQSENITAFPHKSTDYTTPALEAAGQAARAGDAPQSTADVDMDAFVANFNKQPAEVIESYDPRRRYERWARIELRIKNGTPVSVDEQEKLERYKKTDEYRSMKTFYRDFNLDVEDVQA